ncbi:uncharacterized protein EV422DRAFT_536800 [Fimicolochytrium jonesii]|uniref:uncharacterized protein n=1 Tax=Fimicolochytrium jonesii TaxID=1396493 RepID=UPI0022FE0EC9|nr:uncharacterized protein EV422DRAFT_536800 [Fimicolochytrium jonesii]KAI8818773.1 hypothetical protein EV422DRAFT_536800 [Fimicolochytrium jonesii]
MPIMLPYLPLGTAQIVSAPQQQYGQVYTHQYDRRRGQDAEQAEQAKRWHLPRIGLEPVRLLGGGVYSRRHKELLEAQKRAREAEAAQAQRKIMRLAREASQRQRALDNALRERDLANQRWKESKELRRIQEQAAHPSLPPWRLGACAAVASDTRAPGREKSYSQRTISSARSHQHAAAVSSEGLHFADGPPTGYSTGFNPVRRDYAESDYTSTRSSSAAAPVIPRRTLGDAYLSYPTTHNGRNLRAVKGYSVEIHDKRNDVAEVMSAPSASRQGSARSRANNEQGSIVSLPATAGTISDVAAPIDAATASSAPTSSESEGGSAAKIIDLFPAVEGSVEALGLPDELIHGDSSRETWIQSAKTQSEGSMHLRPMSPSKADKQSAVGVPLEWAASTNTDIDSGLSRAVSTAEKGKEESSAAPSGPTSPGDVPPSTTQTASATPRTSHSRARPPSGRVRPSAMSSRPTSGARPQSAKSIKFAETAEIMGGEDDYGRGATVDEDEPRSRITTAHGRDKKDGNSKESAALGDFENHNRSTGAIARSSSSSHSLDLYPDPHLPQPRPHPNATTNQPSKPRVKQSVGKPGSLPETILRALQDDPERIVPHAIKEMLRQDALAAQLLRSGQSNGSQASAERTEASKAGSASTVPSRIPRFRSAPPGKRSKLVPHRIPVSSDKMLKTWKVRDQQGSTEIYMYAGKDTRSETGLDKPRFGKIQLHEARTTEKISGNIPRTLSSAVPAVGGSRDNLGDASRHSTSLRAQEDHLLQSIEDIDRALKPKLTQLILSRVFF